MIDAMRRAYRRAGDGLARNLVRRFRVTFPITGTPIPNVPFLRVVSITVENGYGQRHSHTFEDQA